MVEEGRILQVPVVGCFCIVLLICLPESATTQREMIVQRPLVFQCPDTMERSLHGVEMLASREPLFKRSFPSSKSPGSEFLSERTLQLWGAFARLNSPIKRTPVFPFFQGFRTSDTDLPTKTHSPLLDDVSAKKRGGDLMTRIAGIFRNFELLREKGQRFPSNMRSKLSHTIPMSPCAGGSTPETKLGYSKDNLTPPTLHEVKRQPANYVEPYSSELALPWACQSERYWVDLGANVFPRYVSNTRCLNATCWYGHYQCKPHQIEMPVLVQHFGACHDNRLPADIRNQYLLATTDVSGSCTCGREAG